MDLLVTQGRRAANVVSLVFVVALPHGVLRWRGGCPGFASVPVAAFGAFQARGEQALLRGSGIRVAGGELDLDLIPHLRSDDRLVMVRDVVLRGFTFVGFGLLGQKIGDDGLLISTSPRYFSFDKIERIVETDHVVFPRGVRAPRPSSSCLISMMDLPARISW